MLKTTCGGRLESRYKYVLYLLQSRVTCDWCEFLSEFQSAAHQSHCLAQCTGVNPVFKITLHFVLQKDFYLCLVVRMKTRER